MADTNGERITLVAIDDQADLLRLYRIAFRDTPVEVVGEAHDGASGVKEVEARRPDLVLLDLSMPTMDGLEALIAIRRGVPTSRVVVLSGFGGARMAQVCEELGANRYVEKGVLPSELVDILVAVAKEAPRPFTEPTQALLDRAAQLI